MSIRAPDDALGAEVVGVLEAPPGAVAVQPRRSSRGAPWWLWAVAVGALLPVAVSVTGLFGRVAGAGSSVWEILLSGRTLQLVLQSAGLTAVVTGTAVAIGLAVAWVTVRTNLPARTAWAVLAALPLVIPSYVLALSFVSAFGSRGVLADFIGVSLPRLSGTLGAWLALSLATYPYVFLVAAAALRRLDPALEEAARGLGGSRWKVYRTVVLPQLRPAVAAGALLVALYTLSDFGAVSLMRFDSFTRVIYAQYQGRLDRTPAAVLSAVLIVVALLILWGEERSRGRAAYYTARPSRRAQPQELSPRGKAAATGFLATLVLLGVGLPVIVLGSWLLRGLGRGLTIDPQWDAVAGSLLGSGLAALVAMVVAVPIVVLAVRHRSLATRWLERGVYVVFSLPHITVALAVVFFAANYLGPLYQSLALLVIVYASIFLAQATGAAKASMLQVNPDLEDAARGLGSGSFRTMRDVTLPLIWRGLLAGGALVFLTTMKELPATLLLRPTEFETLAVRIWSAADELFYARAALPALLLLLVAAVPMYFLVLRPKEGAA